MDRSAPDRPLTVVALSGGVDSAVAALRLLEAGHRVEGVFVKSWEEDDGEGHCSAAEDLADAEQVCRTLGIELRTVNLATEYWDRVFEPFLAEHRAGRTPNPDVWCNREIKFDELHEFARDHGGERIATGHYARLRRDGARLRLLKGRDPEKDQSYFLYRLGQKALARALFPVGDLCKPDVRRIAAAAGLGNHARKSSTGICFIGERPFREFLGRYLPSTPGPMLTPEGSTVGEHRGLAFYTVGQRRGLGIGGARGGDGHPWYVLGKRVADNVLIVGQGRDHPLLRSRSLRAADASWVSGHAPRAPFEAHARTRYRQPEQPCQVVPLDEHAFTVEFRHPQWAVTPGQSVVLYDGEVCLGGGIVETRH